MSFFYISNNDQIVLKKSKQKKNKKKHRPVKYIVIFCRYAFETVKKVSITSKLVAITDGDNNDY